MATVSRWIAPIVLAAGLGAAALVPTPAHAQSDPLARVLVDVADVVLRGGEPYYRYGNYGQQDRLIVQRDRYGRPVYYRMVRQPPLAYRTAYGPAYGAYQPPMTARRVQCNRDGNCRVTYYDPRYDQRGGRGHARHHHHGHGRGHDRDDD